MHSSSLYLVAAVFLLVEPLYAVPTPQGSSQILANPDFGPIVSESPYYSDYNGTAPPFPGNYTQPIFPTQKGPPGPDDLLFQNLAGAEWAIYNFYQFGVKTFNESAFVKAGYPKSTYQRIIEIRDNEAGHARLFADSISNTSTKPAQCKYQFGITSPVAFLAAHTIVEISSMAFLTGLILQAKLDSSKAALVAVAETESRHEAWGLIDIWQTSPFGGPVDTAFPYANQILDTTKVFIIPGSCPAGNPNYPVPSQSLPSLGYAQNSTTLLPGSPIRFAFSNPKNQPKFDHSKTYYAVFFHGLLNITEPFDTKTHASRVPTEFEAKGLFLAVIADTPGAPTIDTVVAGPLVIVEQPVEINSGIL
ncbi:hypothetical protein N7G274_000518 [Stereocaulon virgatum]|uniref:Stress response protein rds1p n=1 Tax=Stereocaulon virgatum TaxID=373712 RepID=A0ABR4AUX4_9LECA